MGAAQAPTHVALSGEWVGFADSTNASAGHAPVGVKALTEESI